MPDELRLIVGRVEERLEGVSRDVERGTELAETLGKSVGEIVQQLATIQQVVRDQRLNQNQFWDIHWPGLLSEIRSLSESKLDREIFEGYRIYVDKRFDGLTSEVSQMKTEIRKLGEQLPHIEESVYKSAATTRTIVIIFMVVAMMLHDGLREYVFEFAKKLI